MVVSPGKIEVFAVIIAVLFVYWFGPAFTALVGYNPVVVNAIATAPKVSITVLAGITPPRQMGRFPFTTTVKAMPCHGC